MKKVLSERNDKEAKPVYAVVRKQGQTTALKKQGRSTRPAITVSYDYFPPTVPPHPAKSQKADEQVSVGGTTLVKYVIV